MELKRNGSQPSQKGPEEYFTGTVRIEKVSDEQYLAGSGVE